MLTAFLLEYQAKPRDITNFESKALSHLRLVVGGRSAPAGRVAPVVIAKVAVELAPSTDTAESEEPARKVILAQVLGDTKLTVKTALAEMNQRCLSGRADDIRRCTYLSLLLENVGFHVCTADADAGLDCELFLAVIRPKDLCKSFPELKPYKQSISLGMTLG